MSQDVLVSQKMRLTKSTKGTHVYSAPDSPIPTLYIKKVAFDGEPPSSITIVATSEDEQIEVLG